MCAEINESMDLLTQHQAQARAARISNVDYQLDLSLTAEAATYDGTVVITFDDSGDGDTFLDHRGLEIRSAVLNGKKLDPEWDRLKFTLPSEFLGANNELRIDYVNEYDHGGDGFHQFKDPQDGNEYIYSNFEPYGAHRLFPCFDQPDLKATYSLTVTAPIDWELIANSRESSSEAADLGRSRRTFEKTKRFSTYLFALIAGPYAVARRDHNGIELGLFCRKSLAQYLDEDELFQVSSQGLDFFGEFFDHPYPFGKYDQIFVPEFNAGAMENVGAVTHNEYVVFRDPPTENQRRGRAEVVLHEMAHMWFGNLVTMKWWDDLWLNESFATYMSYLAMTEATRFRGAWQDFNGQIKNWAYRQDQLVTTHPIAATIADTEQTFLNFDGITYGKGASVLKQLVAAIGIDGFREGMRLYFREFQYSNATLAQFLATLEAGSGHDLGNWSSQWLETASLNTISATWEADGERLTSLSLAQSAPDDYPTIRPHQLDVGLVRDHNGSIEVTTIPAFIDAADTEIEVPTGTERPSMVFPNANDQGYFKIALDEQSVAFLRSNIDRIDDELLSQQLWSTLWMMVRDQQLKSTDFIALAKEKLAHESNMELVDSVLGQTRAALGRYVPAEQRTSEARALFGACRAALDAVPEGDGKIIWARSLISSALAPEDLVALQRLLDGADSIAGLTLDQDMRWSIIARLIAFGTPGAMDRLGPEIERDPSDRGERAKLHAIASQPEAAVKAEVWEKVHGEGYGSYHLTRAAMSGFNWTHQEPILRDYQDRFFDSLTDIFDTRDREFATAYSSQMFPSYQVDETMLARSQALLDNVGERPVLRRVLLEANDDLERAINCRAFARTSADQSEQNDPGNMADLTDAPERVIRVGVVCVLRCGLEHLLLEVTDPGSGGHFFIPSGGEVQFSELAADAVLRTVKADIGIDMDDPTLLGVLESRIMFGNVPQHEVMFCFGADVDVATKRSITPESIKARGRTIGLRWLNRTDLKQFEEIIVPSGLVDLVLTPINDPNAHKAQSIPGRETPRDR